MLLTHPITRPQRLIAGKLESLIGVSYAVGARRHGQPSAAGATRCFYSTAPVNPFPAANPSTSNLVRGCDPAVGCFSLSASNLIPVNNSFHTTTPSRFSIRSNPFSKMAATKDYRLLCLENPLLDIQAFGDEALLEKYGLKANDAILAEEKHQGLFEDLLQNYDAKLIAGGAAQNTARGAQYLLPPNSVVYLGGVGDDKYAAILHDAVKQAGLRVEYRVDPKISTGRCGVVITGHNRSMCTELGAANHYDLEHLKKPEVWSLVENAEVYYVGGYHFTVCPPAIMELAKQAASGNKPFILSLSAPFICQFFKEPLDASAPYWDYVIGNEGEAAAYAESHGLNTTDVKEIAKALANLPKENTQRKRVAIITQGTEPTIVAIQGEDEVKEYPVHSIDPAKINDTNGAGDAFAGGFAAGVVEGKSIEESIHMGQWLAKLSIQELGPSYPFPKQAYPGHN
ncbi:adenosine kinase [Neurospora crassa]|uniref:adenosine kinase n=1 Tax=Neurospora crassa (strain ATCC 24698 / 74-OR23-1A / CBS 708.71 / DSM 1257 / FGSC 987) TaxID=367110 RepID=Q7RYP8_NEUCR|nr:adenosine kinase [Neurospora crassa OR74A]EAA28064.2 adenosine kinase [Neurospora crassa OR74A]KHE87893.1 adenosine kinase [Neurospora crassa]|eukprot:XP_957300.2 adenosine kinase [Neurospora crassa OR74A]